MLISSHKGVQIPGVDHMLRAERAAGRRLTAGSTSRLPPHVLFSMESRAQQCSTIRRSPRVELRYFSRAREGKKEEREKKERPRERDGTCCCVLGRRTGINWPARTLVLVRIYSGPRNKRAATPPHTTRPTAHTLVPNPLTSPLNKL